MRYLHTMVRVSDLDASLDFYCNKLGLVEIRRIENEKGRFTLVFLATPEEAKRIADGAAESPVVELTYNWDEKGYAGGRNFGHLAYRVSDIYGLCEKLMAAGVTINRPPRDGHMAFIRSPDGISIELLQDGRSGAEGTLGFHAQYRQLVNVAQCRATEARGVPLQPQLLASRTALSDSAQHGQNTNLRRRAVVAANPVVIDAQFPGVGVGAQAQARQWRCRYPDRAR